MPLILMYSIYQKWHSISPTPSHKVKEIVNEECYLRFFLQEIPTKLFSLIKHTPKLFCMLYFLRSSHKCLYPYFPINNFIRLMNLIGLLVDSGLRVTFTALAFTCRNEDVNGKDFVQLKVVLIMLFPLSFCRILNDSLLTVDAILLELK